MRKYAVITGASSGIGLEFTRLLAADKFDLLIAARDEEQLEKIAIELRKKYSVNVVSVAIDLSELGAADKLWHATKDKQVDVLINNAGFGDLHPLLTADWEKLESMIALNITALTRLSQLAATKMKNTNAGQILNVASIASFFPGPGMATYYATKAYVLSFSEAIAQELAGTGVTVTALCPGPTRSGFQAAAAMENSPLMQGKLPDAKEVASYGFHAMKKNKVVAVHGLKNKITALILPRILPRKSISKAVARVQNPR
jgi:short-subunit dehydrogenase